MGKKIERLDDNIVVNLATRAYTDIPTDFSDGDAMREALNNIVLEKMSKSLPNFHMHKYEFYNLVQKTIDEVLPKRVLDNVGMFANVQFLKHGERATFTRKLGRQRAKSFITTAAPSGAYETFQLDTEEYDIRMEAIGGAARVDYERFLAGREDFTENFEIILQGIEDEIYHQIQLALSAASANMPTANVAESNSFEEDKMRRVINTVRAYGEGAVIFCPPEFAATMDIPSYGKGNPSADPRDIAQIRDTGYLGMFFGTPIILIPQSFTDESNTQKVINTQQAYVFPTGRNKVIDLAMEGDLMVDDFKGRDRSITIEAYKKFGLAIHTHHNWGTYINNGITQEAYGMPTL